MSDQSLFFLYIAEKNTVADRTVTARSAVTCLVNSPHSWKTTVSKARTAVHASDFARAADSGVSFLFLIMSPTTEPAMATRRYCRNFH